MATSAAVPPPSIFAPPKRRTALGQGIPGGDPNQPAQQQATATPKPTPAIPQQVAPATQPAAAQQPQQPPQQPVQRPVPQRQPVQAPTPQPVNPLTSQAQQQAVAAQARAQDAPDRTALAQQALATLEADLQPGFEASQRQVGQNAAKFGRIGAGLTTNELTDLALARQRTLDSEAAKLATNAAGQSLDDRLALSNAALSQFATFSDDDRATQQLALEGELGRGGLDLSRDRLTQDASDSEANRAIQRDQVALERELGTGRLAEDTRQFDATDQFRRLSADRDFVLDDRLAEALAALQGFDLTGTGTAPALTPEEEALLQQALAEGVA